MTVSKYGNELGPATSVPQSCASPAVTQHLDNLSHPGRPGVERTRANPGTPEYEAFMAATAKAVTLTRYTVELRFGPTMMVATAEIDAEDYAAIPNAINHAGGLRLSSKLQTNAPSGNSFQKAAFVFTQSIHSVVVLSEAEIKS